MNVTLTKWDIQDHLKTPEERAHYIEAAIEEAQREGDMQFLATALADVAKSMGSGKLAAFLAGVSTGMASVSAPRTARRKTAKLGKTTA